MNKHTEDKILYTVVTVGGGQDGRDHTDKGGKVILATFDKKVAIRKIGKDSRYKLESSIIDVTTTKRKLLRELGKVNCLILGVE